MKKKSILALGIAALAIVSGYGGMKAYQSNIIKKSDLLVENVVALSIGEDGTEKKYHYKESITCACGESVHYIVVSEKESIICRDVKTITYEVCSEEGGMFTCDDFGIEDVQHNHVGTIIYE